MEEHQSISAFKSTVIPSKELSIENLTENLDTVDLEAPFNEEDFNVWKKAKPSVRKRNPVTMITRDIIAKFILSNPNFKYDISLNPKRTLTNPEEGKQYYFLSKI
jgi:hypothetical protein